MPSFDVVGSSANPGSATTHRCRSVNRTVKGSTSGWASTSAIAMSSASFQYMISSFEASVDGRRLLRDLDDDVAADHRLATEPGVERQPLRGVGPILFVFLHGREVVFGLAYHDVTGGAGTASAAVV